MSNLGRLEIVQMDYLLAARKSRLVVHVSTQVNSEFDTTDDISESQRSCADIHT